MWAPWYLAGVLGWNFFGVISHKYPLKKGISHGGTRWDRGTSNKLPWPAVSHSPHQLSYKGSKGWRTASIEVDTGCLTKWSMIYPKFYIRVLDPSVVIVTWTSITKKGTFPEVGVWYLSRIFWYHVCRIHVAECVFCITSIPCYLWKPHHWHLGTWKNNPIRFRNLSQGLPESSTYSENEPTKTAPSSYKWRYNPQKMTL